MKENTFKEIFSVIIMLLAIGIFVLVMFDKIEPSLKSTTMVALLAFAKGQANSMRTKE